jgi:hypothetical protein
MPNNITFISAGDDTLEIHTTPQLDPFEKYLRARRDALLAELRAIEDVLGIDPTLTASQARRAYTRSNERA